MKPSFRDDASMNEYQLSLREPVVCVVGPTASGKSELAQQIAECVSGEIVSADSMQIYRGMNIGTAKPSMEEPSSMI